MYNKLLSYKELCSLLSLEYKTHKARELQIEKLKEQYYIEKVPNQRNKYIIYRELTSEEKQYIQDTKNYTTYITNVLLNLFSQSVTSTCTYTIREIRENIGMVNKQYFPVKYHKAEINIDVPSNYSGNLYTTKQEWFDISDSIDEAIIKYSLERLKQKGLIEYYNTYKFYKITSINNEQTIYNYPHVLNEDELSDFLQVQVEAMKQIGINKKQDLYYVSKAKLNEYYTIINNYVFSLGYTNYSKAVTVIKPKELYKFVDSFTENFNKLQVEKYLKSKRFKTIPPFIHETLINQLININSKK